jgi:hypothetical protein
VVVRSWRPYRHRATEVVGVRKACRYGGLEEVEASGGGRSVWGRSKRLEAVEGCGGGRKIWRRSTAVVEVVGSSGGGSKVWRRQQSLLCRPQHTRHPPAAVCDPAPAGDPLLAGYPPPPPARNLALAHHPTYAWLSCPRSLYLSFSSIPA